LTEPSDKIAAAVRAKKSSGAHRHLPAQDHASLTTL